MNFVYINSENREKKREIIIEAMRCCDAAGYLLDEDSRFIEVERKEIIEIKRSQLDKVITQYAHDRAIIEKQIKSSLSTIISNVKTLVASSTVTLYSERYKRINTP